MAGPLNLQQNAPGTIFLDQWVKNVEKSTHFREHAEAVLRGVATQEPLFAEALKTPQDVRYHAEGPFLRDHLRLMLSAIFALAEGGARLDQIEEFKRLKGYEVVLDELQACAREHAAFFQVYALCHDIAKQTSIVFDAKQGSRGAEEGFSVQWSHHFDEAAHERLILKQHYLNLFESFSEEHSGLSAPELQVQFYLVHGISIHYPRHAKMIHAPVYDAFLDRMCRAHELPQLDHDLIEDLISHHMEAITGFETDARAALMGRFVKLAERRGYDPDEYIRRMQLAIFFDAVVASRRFGAHGTWQNSAAFVNALRAEHDWAPLKRVQRKAERERAKTRHRNRVFKDVGLDGVALMDLLNLEPGPEFGKQLRRIHAAILGKGEMPSFAPEIVAEIDQRVSAFYEQYYSEDV